MLRSIFGASRFIIAIAVVGAFIGSIVLLTVATLTVLRIAWKEIVDFETANLTGVHVDRLGVELIEITDVILLGTVLYIVALGLYQLFIDRSLPLPAWLKVNDLTDLKRDLIGVVVVLLGVSFLGEVVDWDQGVNLLPLGAAVALVISALGFILWLTPKKHHHADPNENGAASDPIG
ncbi:MAG: YqhA family protein [Chloroflexota bacterium]|nr:YqhA family protein [Chloroflexia bacterium]MDQ3226316.1 YqhA family protein [Chloroflexota bacterium]